MTPVQFEIRFNAVKNQLARYLKKPAYRDMGVTAQAWFREHYKQEHWFDGGGWRPWKKPKRFNPDGTTSQKYGTLLSKRNHLFRNIQYKADDHGATVYNNVPYAEIHNQGGVIEQDIVITPQMRKWAWAMYYKANGIKRGRKGQKGKRNKAQTPIVRNPLGDKYKALALTKNPTIHRTILMPRRPFLYDNAELRGVLREKLKAEIKKIMGFA